MPRELLTVGDVAKLYGVQDWHVRRSVDRLGVELERMGRYRLIPRTLLPRIAAELQARGWLADSGPAPLKAG